MIYERDEKCFSPLGCHSGVLKVITGGWLGKSEGKTSFAAKNPPSYSVSGGPIIMSSQQKMFSSSPKPTDTPSGGFRANSNMKEYRQNMKNVRNMIENGVEEIINNMME